MAQLELSVKQAALTLGVAERTCRKWVEEGKLEGRKVRNGNRDVWRIPAEACRKLRPDFTAAQDAVSAESGAASRAAEVLVDEVRSLREENAEYRRVLELQAQAFGRLTDRIAALEDALRLLPPAPTPEPEAQADGWLKRLFGGRRKTADPQGPQ